MDLTAGGAIAGVAAAACYSSFLVAGPLGSRLSMTDSYVSELQVPGQPASTFFQLTDLAAALFIVVLAGALFDLVWPEVRGTLGSLFLAGAGLAAAGDGLDPMPCTPSTSAACRQYVDEIPLIAQLHQGHTVSSVLGVCCAVMAMLLVGSSRLVRRWRPWLGTASLVGGLLVTVLGLSEVPLTAGVGVGVGVIERVHVLLISAWFAVLGWQLSLARTAENAPVPLHLRQARVGRTDGRNPRRWRHLLPLPTSGGRRAG